MYAILINNVSQILNLGHAKSALVQIGTQLVLPQRLEDLSDVVEVLFPSLDVFVPEIVSKARETSQHTLKIKFNKTDKV